MVGHRPLEAGIGVRIPVPQQKSASIEGPKRVNAL